jgi:RimJ/RimL family protein N-acetyltransferase
MDTLAGVNVGLRPRHPDDVAVLHDGLYNDVATRAQADSRPWIPIPAGDPALSPYAVESVSENVSFFSVVTGEGELTGEALLWGIDTHNRSAHVGLALLPSFRGRGFATEVVQLLCRYGFSVRGLNRLQLETNTTNEPMIRAAKRVGFVEEGVLREASWSLGSFEDALIMGLLADEWREPKA